MWNFIFSLFGIHWVIPSGVVALLECLGGGGGLQKLLDSGVLCNDNDHPGKNEKNAKEEKMKYVVKNDGM